MNPHIKKVYVPMTETAFYILLCLRKPNHGYGIVQMVGKMTDGPAEEIFRDEKSEFQMMQRVLKGRMLPFSSFFLQHCCRCLCLTCSSIITFLSLCPAAVLILCCSIFIMCFRQYNKYKNRRK